VGSLVFNNASSYTIAPGTGGFSLSLDNAGAPAAIIVSSGNHAISAPVTIASAGLNAAIAAGTTLSLLGSVTGAGPLSLTSTGTLKLGASVGAVNLTALSIAAGGTFDINNNHVFVNYGSGSDPIASVAAWIASGFNAGKWNGPGIISSAAAITPGYALGYADSADLGNPANLSSGTIEIKYTLLGDANLDGVVNGIDFGILAANFNHGVTGWDKGDFNYDNVVNGIDFGELAANFNHGASGASVGPGALSDPALVAFAEANGLMADVPEPASAALLVATTLATLSSRRRRRPQAPGSPQYTRIRST
jgi:hypothetical protein